MIDPLMNNILYNARIMRTHSNTIFITGGGAGIGRGLAEAFHRLGNQVIIGGRREQALQETCAANEGMSYVAVDTANFESIRVAAQNVISKFPELNCVINNAGLQRAHDFASAETVRDADVVEEIETNLLGLIRVCSQFVPHLKGRPEATLINVSSGLAFVPLARVPVYCASKAAVHSFCVSLRHQLKPAGIRVVELIPPYVDTNLDRGRRSPAAPAPMPLAEFVAEAMEGLAGDSDEVAVGGAKVLFASSGTGDGFANAFSRMNGATRT
jgi:uncharacterized oxidoreductase